MLSVVLFFALDLMLDIRKNQLSQGMPLPMLIIV